MFHKEPDGTIIDDNGKIIFFSCERFVKDICQGECCFICGISPSATKFNNEHILPNWLLRHFGLQGKSLTLPNNTDFKYAKYTIPCCEGCNTLMGREIEEPIRELVVQGGEAVNDYLRKESQHGRHLFSTWMALIFIKAHLKDRRLRFSRDIRDPPDPISSLHTWEDLHHIYCVARGFYTGCEIDVSVFGSFVTLPARDEGETSDAVFDWITITNMQTMLLRLGDLILLTVFNDSSGVLVKAMPTIERLSGSLSFLQWRELAAEFAFLNCHILERPRYHSAFVMKNEEYRIFAELPSAGIRLSEKDLSIRGSIMHFLLRATLPNLVVKDMSRSEFEQSVISGTYTFLFDEFGNFIAPSDDET